MTGNEELVVCVGEGGDEEEARILSERLGVRLSLSQGENLTVRVDGDGIALVGFGLTFRGDFEQMLRRVGHGHLQHEMLAHAAKTKADRPSAIDATAGMGEDSLILTLIFLIKAAGLLCPEILFNSSAGKPDKYILVQKERRQVCEEIISHYGIFSLTVFVLHQIIC